MKRPSAATIALLLLPGLAVYGFQTPARLLPSSRLTTEGSSRITLSAAHGDEPTTTTTTTKRSKVSRRDFIDTASLLLGLSSIAALSLPTPSLAAAAATPPSDIQQILITKAGKPMRVGDVLGPKATIVVNVASQCALTGGSYTGLVELYEKYHDKGLEILAFPCNQFGYQEPDPVEKIRRDVAARFGVKFPIFDKLDVNGQGAHPLYLALKSYEPELSGFGPKISWNFEKYVLSPEGLPLRRYKPGVDPLEMEGDLLSLMEKGVLPPQRKRSLNEY